MRNRRSHILKIIWSTYYVESSRQFGADVQVHTHVCILNPVLPSGLNGWDRVQIVESLYLGLDEPILMVYRHPSVRPVWTRILHFHTRVIIVEKKLCHWEFYTELDKVRELLMYLKGMAEPLLTHSPTPRFSWDTETTKRLTSLLQPTFRVRGVSRLRRRPLLPSLNVELCTDGHHWCQV